MNRLKESFQLWLMLQLCRLCRLAERALVRDQNRVNRWTHLIDDVEDLRQQFQQRRRLL